MSEYEHFGDRPFDVVLPVPGIAGLVAQLPLPLPEFIEIFGFDWRELTYGDGWTGESDAEGYTPWFSSGTPAQLLLRSRPDAVELAIPEGHWLDHHLRLLPTHAVTLSIEEILDPATPQLVADLLKRRRRTFRYCRYCRNLTPPERRADTDCCYDCQAQVGPQVIY